LKPLKSAKIVHPFGARLVDENEISFFC